MLEQTQFEKLLENINSQALNILDLWTWRRWIWLNILVGQGHWPALYAFFRSTSNWDDKDGDEKGGVENGGDYGDDE